MWEVSSLESILHDKVDNVGILKMFMLFDQQFHCTPTKNAALRLQRLQQQKRDDKESSDIIIQTSPPRRRGSQTRRSQTPQTSVNVGACTPESWYNWSTTAQGLSVTGPGQPDTKNCLREIQAWTPRKNNGHLFQRPVHLE